MKNFTYTIKPILNYTINLLFLCLPIILLIGVVLIYSVNTVFMDDFEPITDYIKIITTGHIDWNALVAFHNEHRIIIPRILTYIIAYFTHYNTQSIMLVSTIILGTGYLIFIRFIITKKIQDLTLIDLCCCTIIGLCLFSFCQYENLLWGFQIAWFLIEFCVIVGIASLSKYIQTNNTKYLIFAIISGIISSFSSLHGLAIFPCYLTILAISQFEKREFNTKLWVTLILTTIIIYALYFIGYKTVPYHSNAKASSLIKIFEYFFMNLGSVLVVENNALTRFIAGLFNCTLTAILVCRLLFTKQLNKNLLPLGIIIFSCGISLVLGIGRSGWIMPSRYMTFPLLMVIGNLAILYNQFTLKGLKQLLSVIAFITLAFLCLHTSALHLRQYKHLLAFRSYTALSLLLYKSTTINALNKIYPFKTYDEAIERISPIEKHRLSIFYQPRGN